ncbi:MAG: proprotein convertase P-domain-containing protein, partial [Limisphaerales bacterium]
MAAIAKDLTGKGAMIQRGTATFERKIQHAADAGAEFVVIYNNVDEAELIRMAGTDYSPIPAYFISKADGDELVQLMKRDPKLRMQLSMESVEHVFELIVDADHSFRGQLRITLESPSGTISVLQRLNHDDSRGPIRWAYRTTRHFFEPTAGTWKVRITDQDPDEIGTLRALRLSLMGTPIEDVDNDGLDDSWERRHFGNLRASGFEDSDADGASNAREQLLQTHPKVSNHLFRMELLPMDEDQLQLQWASLPG